MYVDVVYFPSVSIEDPKGDDVGFLFKENTWKKQRDFL